MDTAVAPHEEAGVRESNRSAVLRSERISPIPTPREIEIELGSEAATLTAESHSTCLSTLVMLTHSLRRVVQAGTYVKRTQSFLVITGLQLDDVHPVATHVIVYRTQHRAA